MVQNHLNLNQPSSLNSENNKLNLDRFVWLMVINNPLFFYVIRIQFFKKTAIK